MELVPRASFSVVLGVTFWMSAKSTTPVFSSRSALKAVTAIGTLSKVSARRRAVTTMSLLSATASGSAVVGVGAVWAMAGTAAMAASATLALSNKRTEFRRVIGFPLLRRIHMARYASGLCACDSRFTET
ncbi:hypothetical protein D9M73_93440 [compost metagenome]